MSEHSTILCQCPGTSARAPSVNMALVMLKCCRPRCLFVAPVHLHRHEWMALPSSRMEAQVANMTEPGHEVVRHDYIWIRDSLENLQQEICYKRVKTNLERNLKCVGVLAKWAAARFNNAANELQHRSKLCLTWSHPRPSLIKANQVLQLLVVCVATRVGRPAFAQAYPIPDKLYLDREVCNPTYLVCAICHDEVPRESIIAGRDFVVSHPVVSVHAALSCDFHHCGFSFKCYLQPLPVHSRGAPESAAVQPRVAGAPVAGQDRTGGQLGVFYFSTSHAERTGAGWKRDQRALWANSWM